MKTTTIKTALCMLAILFCLSQTMVYSGIDKVVRFQLTQATKDSLSTNEIGDLEISCNPDGIHIAWTSCDNSSDYIYFIERSTNCGTFFPIGLKKGIDVQGLSKIWFSYIDNTPLSGESYYRIRRISLEEENELICIEKKVSIVNSDNGIKVMPISYLKK